MGRQSLRHPLLQEIASPATPAAGFLALYGKNDHGLYVKDPTGKESQLITSIVESISRVLVVGHSFIADTNASQKNFGAVHRFGNRFPASVEDISCGGAVAMLPGVNNPDDGTAVGTTKAGWGHVFNQITNRERSTGIDTTFAASTSAGQAAGTSDLVGASAGAVIAVQPVMAVAKATPANSQLTYIQTIPDATHVSFYDVLTNAYANGDAVVAFPDARFPNKQVVVVELDWNDLIWCGPTVWNTSFIHCYRAILARLRCFVHFPATSSMHTWAGTWNTNTPAVGFGDGGGASIRTCTVNGGSVTIPVPPMDAGEQLVLFFRTRANGDGALWTMQVDGDGAHTFTYDTRNINGFAYASGAGTRAANGVEMASCKVIRGLAAGAHTIVATATTVANNADFLGWGIIPADLPPMLVLRPFRWYTYSGLPGTMYTPTDTDQATMDTAIQALVAEFNTPTSDVFGGTAAADPAMLLVDQDSVMQKLRKNYSYDGVHSNDRSHGERGNKMVTAINSAVISDRVLTVATPPDAVTHGTEWLYVASSGSGQPIRFGTGWQNFGSGNAALAYKKTTPGRRVLIRGEIVNTSYTAVGSQVFVLPVGYRPSTEIERACTSYNGYVSFLVAPSGAVTVSSIEPRAANAGGEGRIYMDIEFDAEA